MTQNDACMISPQTVAEWMVSQIEEWGFLSQPEAATSIRDQFGKEFVYFDPFGNLAINRKVLYRFRKMTVDTVVWEVSNTEFSDVRKA